MCRIQRQPMQLQRRQSEMISEKAPVIEIEQAPQAGGCASFSNTMQKAIISIL